MNRIFAPDGFDDTGAGPLYLQLQRRLSQAITDGRLRPGDSLPPERDPVPGEEKVLVAAHSAPRGNEKPADPAREARPPRRVCSSRQNSAPYP